MYETFLVFVSHDFFSVYDGLWLTLQARRANYCMFHRVAFFAYLFFNLIQSYCVWRVFSHSQLIWLLVHAVRESIKRMTIFVCEWQQLVGPFCACLFARDTRNTVGENGDVPLSRKIRTEEKYRHAAEQTACRKEKKKKKRSQIDCFSSFFLFTFNC